MDTKLIVLTHFKMYKSNFFCIVSNVSGQVFFIKNSGTLGFNNIQKRGVQALISLLDISLKKILFLNKKYIFLKFEGFNLSFLKDVYRHLVIFLKKNNITVIGFKHVYKLPHNGCRFKKKR